ncbi:hypothetical protein Q2T46_13635 [Thermoanaerobacterium sp. CMT5567-10]|nr:hypothetical protein [Thermoanaerobacterium sp. CMT5567-10]WKV08556.1 hypothetical protein Q2T46_13635 [Thermoanaerobacterium sp. CMT5567-10]
MTLAKLEQSEKGTKTIEARNGTSRIKIVGNGSTIFETRIVNYN